MIRMQLLLPVTLLLISPIVYSKDLARYGRENTIDLCDTTYSNINNKNKIICFCKNTLVGTTPFVFKAECTIDENNIPEDDDVWRAFDGIKTIERLTLSSKNDKVLTHVPTLALKTLRNLLKITIQHGAITNLHPYAFANLTDLEEIKLSGNGIMTVSINAFAHHPNLTSITLDNNNIEEIKRNMFRRMPQLQDLFLTSNNISVIHDRAFVHLEGLRTLELDKNSIFVLTNEMFLGLEKLNRLELSYNNLEVIGDNTFTHLKSLRSLNLAYNKIKILDDKAFEGLTKLESMSLNHNKIKELANPILFSGLPMLFVLDVKANDMIKFTFETISPIMNNLVTIGSSLGFEDNKFLCDCNLNWFLTLKNRTKNPRLQQTIDNLMCYPDPKLAEDFKKYEEKERSNADKRAEDNENGGSTEYDYYDDKSLEGRLFFSDIPQNMLPCKSNAIDSSDSALKATLIPSLTPTETPRFTTQLVTSVPSTTKDNFHGTRFNTPDIRTSNNELFATTEPTKVYTTIKTHPTTYPPVNELIVTTQKSFVSIFEESPRTDTVMPGKYTPFDKELNPTEEMVSDGESTPTKISLQTTKKEIMSVSTEAAIRKEINQRNLIQDNRENTMTRSKDPQSPKSMSHTHVSNANVSNRISCFIIPLTVSILLWFRL